MNKKVIYTCITGDYDDIPEHLVYKDDWDYILFTDNKTLLKKGKQQGFIIKPLPFNELDNSRNSKYPKILPHLLFSDYDYCVWMDGSVRIAKEEAYLTFEELIKSDEKISIFPHPERNCIYAEAKIIKKDNIDCPKIVDKLIQFLKSENYPIDNGLHANGIIFRKHNDAQLKAAMNMWWDILIKYSHRDQLSLEYVMWKNNMKIHDYNTQTSIYNDPNFQIIYLSSHNRCLKSKDTFLKQLFSIEKEVSGKVKRTYLHLLGIKIRVKKRILK